MKKLVRKSCFECNSSSSHSISLAGDDKQFILDTILPDQFGKVYVTGGQFGWEWAKYNDAETKLSYAYQDLVPKEILERVIKEQTGAAEVVFLDNSDGYIDHESFGTARGICVDDDATRNFIFNKNSWLFTGNDNSDPDPTYYHVPVYETNKVIQPVYKYELVIEGLDKTTKFADYPTDVELRRGICSLLDGELVTEAGIFVTESRNIYFQITRTRDFFELSLVGAQDFSDGFILMIREGNHVWGITEKLRKENSAYSMGSWIENEKLVLNEVLKYENLYRKIPFTLKEI